MLPGAVMQRLWEVRKDKERVWSVGQSSQRAGTAGGLRSNHGSLRVMQERLSQTPPGPSQKQAPSSGDRYWLVPPGPTTTKSGVKMDWREESPFLAQVKHVEGPTWWSSG